VIVPVFAAGLLAAGADELLEPEAGLDELLLEQPATAIAASATAARAKRRTAVKTGSFLAKTGIITRHCH
jgi:hypothetical protein